jgi:hypothetical protein
MQMFALMSQCNPLTPAGGGQPGLNLNFNFAREVEVR